ncbi:MAG: hypothetical protein K5781_07925, partial [Nitrosopumilus sp.]|nr:hypothetical protein [Nitrosopumilus sp.]
MISIFVLASFGSILTLSYASVESEAQEDIQAGCRDQQTLVYRFAYKDYVCVTPSTAERWEELGFAEIKKESSNSNTAKSDSDDDLDYESKYPGAPPQVPKKSSNLASDSSCREGQTLVYRFGHHDTFCMNLVTAITWERLGLVTILDDENTDVLENSNDILDDVEEITETPIENELETPIENELET